MLKDIILVTAALVIAAASFRGVRLIRGDLAPGKRQRDDAPLDAEQKLGIVLEGIRDESLVGALCERTNISEAQFYDWRAASLSAAAQALTHNSNSGSNDRSRRSPDLTWPVRRDAAGVATSGAGRQRGGAMPRAGLDCAVVFQSAFGYPGLEGIR